jgi:TolA-binding protein
MNHPGARTRRRKCPRAALAGWLALTLLLAACATMSQRGALTRAQEYYRAGQPQQALESLERARGYRGLSAEDSAGALLLEGLCYEQLKRRADATTVYLKLVDVYPGTPFAAKARERLKALRQ